MQYDPNSPEAQEKFRQELIAKGWTFHERLGSLVPPGTTEEQVDLEILANQARAAKMKQSKEKANQFVLFLFAGFIVAIWLAPWVWIALTVCVTVLGIVVCLGGYKGSSDEGPGGAGKLGPF